MKILSLKFKIIIGVALFMILICCYYSANIFNAHSSNKIQTNQVGNIVYKGKFLIPSENFNTVTSKYGYRIHPITGKQSFHSGIDLVGSAGSKILNIKEGEVTWAGLQNGYGNCVEVKHIDENGITFYSFYAHMRDNSICVSKGQVIQEGQVIGIQGSTGNSTGDHLHFEIRLENKTTVDPASYLFSEI